ncbi:MAG: hypothetical protein ABR509_01155 [Candidatus Limnocylindria bacterium]
MQRPCREREKAVDSSWSTRNAGWLHVLEKCGYRVMHRERGLANARGEEIEEVILELAGTDAAEAVTQEHA